MISTTLQRLPLGPDEGDNRRLQVVELFAVEHRQVEQGQVDRVSHRQVDPLKDFLAGAGADGANEVEEPVAEQERAGVRHLDAVLKVKIPIIKEIGRGH